MITVKSKADLPAVVPMDSRPGAHNFTYYLRSQTAPNVVVEAWGGEAYALASGEWPEEGYYVEKDRETGKVSWRVGILKAMGDPFGKMRRRAA